MLQPPLSILLKHNSRKFGLGLLTKTNVTFLPECIRFKPSIRSKLCCKIWRNSIYYKQFARYSAFGDKSLNENFNSWMWKAPKPKMGEIRPQNFDYLIVLDFEATCGSKGHQPIPQEIIEFPCALLNVRKGFEVEAIFHQYVRPVKHPLLTTFCTELTGITQVRLNLERR